MLVLECLTILNHCLSSFVQANKEEYKRPVESSFRVRYFAMRTPFRFLDLPPELRVMVYKSFSLVTRRHTLHQRDELADIWPVKAGQPWTMEMFRKSHAGIALLTTCRIINVEATPIFQVLLSKLKEQPVRFILDLHALRTLIDSEGWLVHCFPSTSLSPLEDLSGADRLPLEVRTFVRSSYSFLSKTRYQPLSATRPFDVELLITVNVSSAKMWSLEIVGKHVAGFAEWARLSVAVKRQQPWPRLWPFGASRRGLLPLCQDALRGDSHPPRRPALRLLPAPSQEQWTRDWTVGEVE